MMLLRTVTHITVSTLAFFNLLFSIFMITVPGTAEAMWDKSGGDKVCIRCHNAVLGTAAINVAVDGIEGTNGTIHNSGTDSIEIDWMFEGSTLTDNKEASGILMALPQGWIVENGTLNAPALANWSPQWDDVDGGRSWTFLTDSDGDCPAEHECYAVHFTDQWDHDDGFEDMACNMGPVACDGGIGGTDLDGVRNRFGTDALVRPYPGTPPGNYTIFVYGIGYAGTTGGSVNQTINVAVSDSGTVSAESPASLDNDSSNGGTVVWNDPGNAAAQDNTYSNADNMDGETSVYLISTNFGFSIPDGATIDGIVVEVDGHAQKPDSVSNAEVKIIRNGEIGSQNRAAAGFWPESDTNTYRSYGGSSDLWGETWTPADINSPDFGFALSVSESGSRSDVFLDHVRITVYYSTGGGSGGNRTFYTIPSSGVNIANGIQTDHGSCRNDPSSSYTEELSTDLDDMCTSSYRYRQYSTGLHSEHYFNTAYTSDTTVTGVSYQFTIHDGGTFGVQLFYVTSDGSRTYLGAEVTQSNPHDEDNNYTLDLSGQSGTVPAGAKLGLRTRLVSLSDSYATVYLGNPDGKTGNISGKLMVDETPAEAETCTDGDSDGYAVCDGNCDPGGLLCGDCNDGDQLINPSETDVCDGIDNDCDGSTDEGFPNLGTSCTVGTGACEAAGTYVCTGDGLGTECDAIPGTPSAEICDNQDNNCDGSIDENLTRSISCGVGECGSTGTETCTAGTWGNNTCTPGLPSAETCDNLDNNCDGVVDDFTRSTSCGVGECTGNTGEETCTAGTWGGDTCNSLAGAIPEVCDDAGSLDEDCDGLANSNDPECGCVPTGILDDNCDGIDDDCDGTPDDEYVPVQCGTSACVSSSLCTDGVEAPCQPEPPVEQSDVTCDGIDGDCDGQIDEDYVVDNTCGAGICQTNNAPSSCVGGVETQCQPGTPTETPEATCNDGVDNDCDDTVDGADPDCGGADIPPPVRQEIGVQDGLFNNLEEPDCRFCHEDDADIPVEGRCSVANTVCFQDADCPVDETCDSTRIQDRHHILVLTPEFIPDGSLIFTNPDSPTDPDTDNDGIADSFYACESCHPDDPGTPIFEFPVTRNCLLCHVQLAGTGSVHHLTPTAQGTNSPIGDPNVGDCTPCHGTLVDDTGDGHVIPTFDPTPETPKRSGGNGVPFNSRGNGAGACNYCHDDGISLEGIQIETNMDTHHNTGLGPPVEDPVTSEKCAWCHDFTIPFEGQIRICENCHGQDSLHNIQADSDGDGVINPGIELPFYGHIGDPDDCWGCHGFGASSVAPESGPVIPTISSISEPVLTEGTNTTVTLSGTAFTNMDEGTELTSDVVLIAPDGSSTILIPDAISEGAMTVTIPDTLAKGNYKLKTEKLDKQSNPKVISIKPPVNISSVKCRKNNGQITIDGTGFNEKPEGTDAYLNVVLNGQTVTEIISWSDTQIKATVSSCPSTLMVTVNGLYGVDTAIETKGKIPKPKK